MKRFKWLRKLRQAFGGATRSGAWANAWLRGEEESAAGPVMLTSAFQQSTWIYACVTTLAENVSAIPFRIAGEGSGADAAARLFAQPHRHMDRFAFWELVIQWLCLRGEVFMLPVREFSSVRSVVKELLLLSPDQMREIVAGHELAGWKFTGSGANSPLPSTVLLPEEVIHIRLPNPFHLWRGMSPLTVAWLAAQTDYAAAQFMKGAMINNADTGLIVSVPEQPEPAQLEQLKAALRERKRAAGTADRPLLMFNGAKIEKPGITAMDLEFLENRKFNRQEICAIYKVPQELLGYTEDANRSVSDAARLNFVENRIAPLCKRLEAGIDPIVRMFGRELRGEFHVKATPVMQAAQRARIDSGLKLFGVGVPLNVVNQVLDLGLPDLAHGDRSFLSSRYQELVPQTFVSAVSPTFQSAGRAKLGPPAGWKTCDTADRNVCGTRTVLDCGGLPPLSSKQSRHIFELRSRALSALERGRAQIESGIVPDLDIEDRLKPGLHAVIADAIHRGEPYELITRRVRAYFNQLLYGVRRQVQRDGALDSADLRQLTTDH